MAEVTPTERVSAEELLTRVDSHILDFSERRKKQWAELRAELLSRLSEVEELRKQVQARKCDECGGNGWRVKSTPPHEHANQEQEQCPVCEGLGRITELRLERYRADKNLESALTWQDCAEAAESKLAAAEAELAKYTENKQVGTCVDCGTAIWFREASITDDSGTYHPICRVGKQQKAAEAEAERLRKAQRETQDKCNQYAILFGPLDSQWNDVMWLRNQLVLANEHVQDAESSKRLREMEGALRKIQMFSAADDDSSLDLGKVISDMQMLAESALALPPSEASEPVKEKP